MGFKNGMKNVWEKMKSFWVDNMDKSHKKVSIAFGIFLIGVMLLTKPLMILWTGGLSKTYSDFITGSWDLFMIFLAVLIGTFFGNNRENGNKEEEK